jgi:hypothetical protein
MIAEEKPMMKIVLRALFRVAAIAILIPTPGTLIASTITVSLGNGTIQIKGGTAGATFTAYAHPPNQNTSTKDMTRSGTLNSSGDSGNINTAGLTGTYEYVIGTENFLGIPVGTNESKNIQVQSLQEQNASINLFHGSDPVFASTTSSIFETPTGLVDQFNIENSDTLNGYEITSLDIYSGLNPAFYTAGNFDSLAAIASGTFVEDWAAATGGISIPMAGGPDLPFISVPVADANYNSYDLITGTAAPILADGTLGASFTFSSASLPETPEPAPILLLGSGLLFLFIMRRVRTA